MKQPIVNISEKCPECTSFGENIKPSKANFRYAKPRPLLSARNQEIQLDFAGPLIDEREGKNVS